MKFTAGEKYKMKWLICCCFKSFLLICICTSSPATSAAELPKQLKSTVVRYLSADADYRPGDLITQSQLKEIQAYLRRTQGNSPATHPKWRKRMLPDKAHLASIFYSGGGPVLRQAAAKLGGYGELDRLSKDVSGRRVLQDAIESNSPDKLIRALQAKGEKTKAQRSNQGNKPPAMVRSTRIYTAAEFLAALAAPLPGGSVVQIRDATVGDEQRTESVRPRNHSG